MIGRYLPAAGAGHARPGGVRERQSAGSLRRSPPPAQRPGQVLIPAGDPGARRRVSPSAASAAAKAPPAAQVGRSDVRPVQDGPARERVSCRPLTVQAAPIAAKPAAQAKRLGNRRSKISLFPLPPAVRRLRQGRGVGGKGGPGVGTKLHPAPQRHGGVTGQPHAVSGPADLHAGPGQKAQKRV